MNRLTWNDRTFIEDLKVKYRLTHGNIKELIKYYLWLWF